MAQDPWRRCVAEGEFACTPRRPWPRLAELDGASRVQPEHSHASVSDRNTTHATELKHRRPRARGLLTSTETVPRLETPLLRTLFPTTVGTDETLVGNSARHPCAPNLLHRGPAHPQLLGHRPGAPMRLALGFGMQGRLDDRLHRLRRDRRLGPPALADLAQLASPFSANRVRHARTITAVTPKLAAIRVLATPSAAINSARARCTCRCGASRPRRPVSPSGRPGEEVMDRARLRPGGHRRRVDGPVRGDDKDCARSRDPPPEDPPRVGIPVAFQRVQRAAVPDEREGISS